jgi:hypothetical protein
MPFIVTTMHDPYALAETCRQCNLPAPKDGSIQLGDREVTGWIVHLPGVQFPIVCNTLTGLVAYHPRDNAFMPYRSIMRFVHRFYAIRHRMWHGKDASVSGPRSQKVYHFPRPRAVSRRDLIADAG